jgi:phenylacetate-CoA ligase
MSLSLKHRLLIRICKANFIFPFLLGPAFIKYRYSFLKKNNRLFDPSQKLLNLLGDAISNVPFYSNKKISSNFQSSNLPDQFDLIDKEIVMSNWDDFQHKHKQSISHVTGTTGGTSGKALKLVLPKNRYVFELGTMYKMWSTVGWNGQTRAVLRNQKLKHGEPFKIDFLRKEIIFDGFNTDPEYFQFIYDTLKKFGIKFLHAYPSSAYQFALFLEKQKLDATIIKSVFCGSEGLLANQREKFKSINLRVYHWYGHSEKLILGGYCENSDYIHIEPTYGYAELIDEKGYPVKIKGELGELVGTTLHNKVMPLIRYRTGDYGRYEGDYCPHCKRNLLLLSEVRGRWDKNKIYLKDGTYVTTTALNLHSELNLVVDGLQYVQLVSGLLEIRLIKNPNYNSHHVELFKNHFDMAFKNKLNYIIKYVNELEKEPNGKFLVLKQYFCNTNEPTVEK